MSRRPKPQTAREIRERDERKQWYTRITRDLVLFVLGAGLLINEATRHGGPRESLLIIIGGCLGLPAILRAEEIRHRNGKNK